MTIGERVYDLAGPICRDLGVELFDVEFGGGVLRVTVERDGGVSIDTIALITRELSRALDHADPIPGRYTLEVSSPGLERTLRRPAHFARALGSAVKIKTQPFVEGDRRIEGILTSADDGGIVVRLGDSTERALRFDQIERAQTVFEWGPAPKPGKTKNARAKSKAGAKATDSKANSKVVSA